MTPSRPHSQILLPLVVGAMLLASGCVANDSPSEPTVPPPTRGAAPAAPATPPADSRDEACDGLQMHNFEDTATFSGSNALGHVISIACDFDTAPPTPRYRVPGTEGRVQAARYIHEALAQEGWNPSYQNFSGEEYQRLDHASASPYTNNCDEADRRRVNATEFSNVVAEKGAGSISHILVAHYEGQRHADQDARAENRTLPVLGANDGLSGVGVLLELARVMNEAESFRIRLLFVDGEDGFGDCHPLAGSIFHAHSLTAADRSELRSVIVLDMVGDAEPNFCLAHNDDTIADDIRDAALEVQAPLLSGVDDCTRGLLDDHTSFADVGLRVVDIIDFAKGFPEQWNTRHDWPHQLSPDTLEQVGRVVTRLPERASRTL